MSVYKVTAHFEVEGPPESSRAVEKLVHATVQSLVGDDTETVDGLIEITGACCGVVEKSE